MTPALRKFALTAHVVLSVGWLGAVAGFLALALAGLAGNNAQTVRGAYIAMDLTGWFVIVPLTFAALLSGVIQALGTPWGLLRHYWVIVKLGIALLCSILVLVHMQPTRRIAETAAAATLSGTDLHAMRVQLLADSSLALVALLVAVVLAVYKPRGMTRYAARKEAARGIAVERPGMPRWVKILGAIGIAALLIGRMFAGHGGLHSG